MNQRRIWTLAVVAGLICRISCAYGQETKEDPWAPLGLIDVPCNQCRLRVAPEFREHFDVISAWVSTDLAEHRARLRAASANIANAPEILARINEILGFSPDEEQAEYQENVFRTVGLMSQFPIAPADEFTMIIIQRDRARKHLRDGGTLPKHKYDPATDSVSVEFGISKDGWFEDDASELEALATREFCVPLADIQPEMLESAPALFLTIVDLSWAPIHETVELSIHTMIDFADRNGRWFGDGFANVITMLILCERGLTEAADELALSLDVTKFEDIPKSKLILRYWPNSKHEIRGPNTVAMMTDYESHLRLARYAWAFHECQRIVDDHGIEIIARIMQAAAKQKQLKSQYLVGLVSTVTGDDISARLHEYQDFSTAQAGVEMYNQLVIAANDTSDFETAFTAASRSMEIALRFENPYHYMRAAARYLALMGRLDDALTYIDRVISEAEEVSPQLAIAWQAEKLTIAFHFGQPDLAYASIDPVLELHPNNPFALATRAHQLLYVDGKNTEAQNLASKLLANEQHEWMDKPRAMLEAIIIEAGDHDRERSEGHSTR